jgi:hypothetical protein
MLVLAVAAFYWISRSFRGEQAPPPPAIGAIPQAMAAD